MANAEKLIKLLDFNLSNQKFDNAKKLLNDDEEYGKVILSHYPEVIQEVIMKYLTPENYIKQPSLYEACEYILNLFAEKCHQQGILFEFLEILETVKSDDVFRSILKALQIILLKQSEKKSRSLEYVLNSIEDYILELELPKMLEKKYLDDDEEQVLENDEKVRRILMNYITLDLFYRPIVKQITENPIKAVQLFRSIRFNRQNVLFCFILRLLGKPLSLLNLCHNSEEDKVKSYSREVAENLVTSLCKINPDVFNLLRYVETRCRWPAKDKIDDDLENIYLHPEKFPVLQTGVLLYLILVEGICIGQFPRVYSNLYILKMGIYLINEMISSNDIVAPKGLKLFKQLLLNACERLPSDELEMEIYEEVCANLVKLLIYSPSKRNRQEGLAVLRMYILKFDTAGRCLLIKTILNNSTHKGLIGYLTTLYKDLIFAEIDSNSPMPSNLCGFYFKQLVVNTFCKLENGVKCDLTDSSDQIIAALNFLIGVVQRDKQNKTGIRKCIPELEQGFLSELRSALDFSRAHFMAERDRVKFDSVKAVESAMAIEILNDTSDETMNDITKEKKMEMLRSALSMFDLIEFHLSRVIEIINRQM